MDKFNSMEALEIAMDERSSDHALREALSGACGALDATRAMRAEDSQLCENLMGTIAAIVISAGGRIEVKPRILEDLPLFDLAKIQGLDGSVIYSATRRSSGGA